VQSTHKAHLKYTQSAQQSTQKVYIKYTQSAHKARTYIVHNVSFSAFFSQNVCVRGISEAGPGKSCRGLVWGIYLDGGESGILVHGNVIEGSSHGAIFDNAGGNNTHMNNVFIGYYGKGGYGGSDSGLALTETDTIASNNIINDSSSSSSSSNGSDSDSDSMDAVYSAVLMDFGAPGGPSSPNPDGSITDRDIAGSVVKRNVFYWVDGSSPNGSDVIGTGGTGGTGGIGGTGGTGGTGGGGLLPPMQMIASMGAWSNDELKRNGSDFNVYWTKPILNAAAGERMVSSVLSAALVFPGGVNLSTWQGLTPPASSHDPVQCGMQKPDLILDTARSNITNSCDWGYQWHYNTTDFKLRAISIQPDSSSSSEKFCLNIDCDGNWDNCANGTTDTHLCLSAPHSPWVPHPEPPAVSYVTVGCMLCMLFTRTKHTKIIHNAHTRT
jgi:hypothetical protein